MARLSRSAGTRIDPGPYRFLIGLGVHELTRLRAVIPNLKAYATLRVNDCKALAATRWNDKPRSGARADIDDCPQAWMRPVGPRVTPLKQILPVCRIGGALRLPSRLPIARVIAASWAMRIC